MTQFDTHSFDEITTAVTNNVLHIRFNRPHKKNAMNLALVNDVVTCFDMLESSGIRAVVIEGSDGNFVRVATSLTCTYLPLASRSATIQYGNLIAVLAT